MPKIFFNEQELEEAKQKLRDTICDLYESGEFIGMGHVAVSEVLIRSAFAWRDFQGGEGDTRHAAKVLHELVDNVEAEKIAGR